MLCWVSVLHAPHTQTLQTGTHGRQVLPLRPEGLWNAWELWSEPSHLYGACESMWAGFFLLSERNVIFTVVFWEKGHLIVTWSSTINEIECKQAKPLTSEINFLSTRQTKKVGLLINLKLYRGKSKRSQTRKTHKLGSRVIQECYFVKLKESGYNIPSYGEEGNFSVKLISNWKYSFRSSSCTETGGLYKNAVWISWNKPNKTWNTTEKEDKRRVSAQLD